MIAVACHDAGGAEIVSSLVRRGGLDCRFALAGPAAAVFARKLGSVLSESPADIVSNAERLICGTSSPATLELDAIRASRARGIKSIAILDHWINYEARFRYGDELVLPDEIGVVDAHAERLAKSVFPQTPIVRIDNPYKQDVLERLATMGPVKTTGTALYVTEPTSVHAARQFGNPRYWGYTEVEALRWFLAGVPALDGIHRVVVRPHPSEDASAYRALADAAPVDVVFGGNRDLLDEIAAADLVAGCNSMAMVVAVWAGKRVVCCIPPAGRGFALPPDGIEFAAQDPAWVARFDPTRPA